MDLAFADVNVDTVELLVHHGCEVVFPPSQACCGSLQAHNGEMDAARSLARQNVEAFTDLNLDALVMNSAGCGAFMKEYGSVLRNEAEYAAPAAEIGKKVKDISEFLCEIGLRVNGSSARMRGSKRVTYHDACHLVHSQKISEEPRKLIRSIPSVDFVELPESTWCCGSAGVYNILQPEIGDELGQQKVTNLLNTGAELIASPNPGCGLQIRKHLEIQGKKIPIMHPMELLDYSIRGIKLGGAK